MILRFGSAGIFAALGVAMAVSGCSTMLDVAGVARAGHQPDGTYVVSEDEEHLACRQIRERMDGLRQEISVLPERAAVEKQSTPTTVGLFFGRMFGQGDDGLKAMNRYKEATAENDALRALYVRKRCI